MTIETPNQSERIIYLYCITCIINQKIYIGQTVDPNSRWRAHRRDAADPKVPIQFAIKKYGSHNFEFEIIATCKGQNNANYLETLLVIQYNSYVSNNKGYNATHGGMNAPKSEEWLQKMRDFYATMSPERRAEISKKQSISFTKYIKENGHIALGTKRTDEQKANMSIIQQTLDRTDMYPEEVRKQMSESHIGIKDSEETKQKKAISATEAWDKRNAERFATKDIRCQAPGCEIAGKAKYKIIQGARYCNKHGLRMLRYGRLDLINI
jgi:group I intron endonuclease